METPPITITASDFDRIETYLHSAAVRALPGISMLQAELMRADVVDADDIHPDIITMNTAAVFVDEMTDKEYQLTLVFPEQAGTPGTVSILAPVGSALLGLTVGQAIKWQIPGGRELLLRVKSVLNQPEHITRSQTPAEAS